MSAQLDPVIHPTHRLKICAMLDAGTTVEMSVIKDTVGLSPSALSKQVGALVDAGYVAQERSLRDSRRIWLTLTKEGKRAYRGHVRALQEILAHPLPVSEDIRVRWSRICREPVSPAHQGAGILARANHVVP